MPACSSVPGLLLAVGLITACGAPAPLSVRAVGSALPRLPRAPLRLASRWVLARDTVSGCPGHVHMTLVFDDRIHVVLRGDEHDCVLALGATGPMDVHVLPFFVRAVGEVRGEIFWVPDTAGTWVCRGRPEVCVQVSPLRGGFGPSLGGDELLIDFGDRGVLLVRPGEHTLEVTAIAPVPRPWGGTMHMYGQCGDRAVMLTYDQGMRDVRSDVLYAELPRIPLDLTTPMRLDVRSGRTLVRDRRGRYAIDLCSGERFNYPALHFTDWDTHRPQDWLHLPGREGSASLRPEGRSCVYRHRGGVHRWPPRPENDPPCPATVHVDRAGALWSIRGGRGGLTVERWVGQPASGSR